MVDEDFHKMMEEAYQLQSQDRESFQQWVKEANKEEYNRVNDPNHNAYAVSSKLPPLLYRKFYKFCRTNNWSKSTAVKFAIHQLLSEQ